MRIELDQYFQIFVVGEGEDLVGVQEREAVFLPVIHQPLLRVAAGLRIAFAADHLESIFHHGPRALRRTVARQDGRALDLCKIVEPARAQRARGFAVDIGHEMRRAEIVAVELFLIGAFLLADIDLRTDGEGLCQRFERRHDRYCDGHGVPYAALELLAAGT